MSGEGIPQSVLEATMEVLAADVADFGSGSTVLADDAITAALREYERLGYRLVRDGEGQEAA